MKTVSIIIVTYNSEKDIYDCVEAIAQHSDIPLEEIELIVVDNNSKQTDAMFARLAEMWDGIILIKNTQNGGYGQGNNIGIMQATAPIIMIMNPDVRLYEPVFQPVIETFTQNDRVTMYGMKQMLTPQLQSLNSINSINTVNGYMSTFLSGVCNRFDFFFPSVMYLNGACFFIRKSMFEQIGCFDESIFMYGEENDIHFRMGKKFGNNIVYNSKLHYLHLTMERKTSVASEDKILRSLILSNQKNGYPPQLTIRNKIQNLNFLMMKERISKFFGSASASERIAVYQEYKQKLKEMQKEFSKQ